jgi:Omp85 superfamily domain
MRLEVLTVLGIVMAAARAHADCPGASDTQTLPLPVWATDPNEGSTWGAMPVFVHVCRETKQTEWILAPSVTWNSIIEVTGTMRFYDYPDPDTSFSLIASASTHVNYDLLAIWQQLPTDVGGWTDEATLRIQRSIFDRFYGLGPDTPASAESSYTGSVFLATVRRGLNLPAHVNIGLTLGFEHDGIEDQGVPGLPLAPQMFPDAPGMGGATTISQGVDGRYDDRDGRDFAAAGLRLDASGAVVEGLDGAPNFLRFGAGARAIWPELSWLSGATHLAWTGVTAKNVPFYLQSELGGAILLRGFNFGRFIDRQAWTIEVEQRIRILRMHIFGVIADWRIDPFITTGQVFSNLDAALSRPQFAAGVGLRAFVHPNVVGRIDLADGGDGLKVYVEIGYPY